MTENITTVKEYELALNKDKKVERSFIMPIKDLLFGMKLVEKDKDKKVVTPYVKIEIVVPREVGTTIRDVMTSEWHLGLIGIKYKS